MGTRGIMGFRVDGTDKLLYNHFDSYPSGLGEAVLNWLREQLAQQDGEAEMRERIRALVLVDGESTPTPEQIARLQQYHNPAVSSGSSEEWYSLLRGTQGDPEKALAAGFGVDSADFMKDSIFCEWAYIINCDERVLEVYTGFQKKRHKLGRYAPKRGEKFEPSYPGGSTYYPVALAHAFPFDELPEDVSPMDIAETLSR